MFGKQKTVTVTPTAYIAWYAMTTYRMIMLVTLIVFVLPVVAIFAFQVATNDPLSVARILLYVNTSILACVVVMLYRIKHKAWSDAHSVSDYHLHAGKEKGMEVNQATGQVYPYPTK